MTARSRTPFRHAPADPRWRQRLHTIIFESNTPAGRAFDVLLLALIVASVLVIMLDSVRSLEARHGRLFFVLEWCFTVLFTVEYGLRLAAVKRPVRYATSFFGIIDLLAILPSYLSLFFATTPSLMTVRVLRLLRIFRIFKLAEHLDEADVLLTALRGSARKITVFLTTTLTLVVVFGSLMYLIEGPQHGYTSIPTSVYWAIVTLTTVGFGDITPKTPLGQGLASLIMLLGYGLLAVPTGIYAAELSRVNGHGDSPEACPGCGREGHDGDARHCKFCGTEL